MGNQELKGFVELAHGSGGRQTHELIEKLFKKYFSNQYINQGNDFALCPESTEKLVISTDGHVISPLFFPGGDIGSLSVHGTVNDVAMSGGTPRYLTASFILEAGFPLSDLEKIVKSMAAAADKAGVLIVTGDTKVVEKGKGDGIFISTTGIGTVPQHLKISGHNAQPGDAILISGSIGDHGIAIMSKRENLTFETDLCSDSAALSSLVAAMVAAVPEIHCLRDPTRGGVAATLNEIAQQSQVGVYLQEQYIPIKAAVLSACELLGLDPLNVANEGKLIAICSASDAPLLLKTMQSHPLGRDAAIIGQVIQDEKNFVQMETKFGGKRMIDWLAGEQLPRIC